ncbi:MAG: tautomerase family protein [Candidatus Lokiarchaeota archaeon]|nr:tautomerase family protein [Candidatus Lokiarchaeota archaeon]
MLEITIFTGRHKETKKKFVYKLMRRISSELTILLNNIEIIFLERESHNWGIRGLTGNDLDLSHYIQE